MVGLPPSPGDLWRRVLIFQRHEELTRDLERVLDLLVVVRAKLPRYLEVISPYLAEDQVATLKLLLKPFPSTDDIILALEVLHTIEWEGV